MTNKISVIMTVYNQKESFLRNAIESVLAQTMHDFELLLIDDGSSLQECIEILNEFAKKDPRVKLIKNKQNLGVTKSRNKGLSSAQGKYIAVLDSDDLADKQRFEKQFNFLEKNHEYALCASWTNIINEQNELIGKKQSPTNYNEIRRNIIKYNFITHSSCFFRKNIIEKLGLYSEDATKTEDYDFLLRIIGKFPIAIIPEYLCSYRINTAGVSLSNNKIQEKYAILARLKAMRRYGYPKIYYAQTILPILMYFFLPTRLKQLIIKNIWDKSLNSKILN